MRSRTNDFAVSLRTWCVRTSRLIPGGFGGLVLMAMMATAQESKDAPGTAPDPFSQPPGPPITEPYRFEGLNWTLPPVLRLYEVDPEERDEWLEADRGVTPDDIERFREMFLARCDPEESYSRGSILFATRFILRKMREVDAQGIAYDRDILIETILEQIKQDFPLDITANFRYLKGTRDPRIRDYVASLSQSHTEESKAGQCKAAGFRYGLDIEGQCGLVRSQLDGSIRPEAYRDGRVGRHDDRIVGPDCSSWIVWALEKCAVDALTEVKSRAKDVFRS